MVRTERDRVMEGQLMEAGIGRRWKWAERLREGRKQRDQARRVRGSYVILQTPSTHAVATPTIGM